MKINPKWAQHNDMYNEGAEGYNPYPKFIAEASKPKYQDFGASRVILGKKYTQEQALDTYQKLVESLPKHTDQEKIKGCQRYIDEFYCLLHFACGLI